MSYQIQKLLDKAEKVCNDYNEEKTQILQNDQRFKDFNKWFEQNGGIQNNIKFPACFGNIGYTGISYTDKIQQNTAFLAIPNKIIISTQLVRQSELNVIIQENSQFFEQDQNQDADFNILTLFVMKEKAKGKDSFYYAWFNITDENYCMYNWSNEELDKLDDDTIKEFQNDLYADWSQMKQIIIKYPQYFDINLDQKELFYWSFQYVMTRCYGWSLPNTMLIPMGDCLNHHSNAIDHFMVDKEKELDEEQDDYIQKKQQVNLDILEIPGFNQKKNWKFDMIENNLNLNPENLQHTEIRNKINQINFQRIEKNEDVQIYNINFNLSSDSEDNDTESEEEEEQNKLTVFNKFRKEELQQQKYGIGKEILDKIIEQEKQIENDDEDLDDSNWQIFHIKRDWYDLVKNDQYFIVYNQTLAKKNEQVYNCYGRRSNKFLILWYGFCMINNVYDSFGFRLNLKETQKFQDKDFLDEEYFKRIYFNQHIPFESSENINDQTLIHNGQDLDYNDISKLFKIKVYFYQLKKYKFPIELMDFFRLNYLTNCADYNNKRNLLSIPSDFEVELKIIKFVQKFFSFILKSKIPIEKDIEELNNYLVILCKQFIQR